MTSTGTSDKWSKPRETLHERLPSRFEPRGIEDRVRSFWEEVGVRRLTAEAVSSSKPLGFVEGPPTLNGEPHIGHVRGRIMKDLWYRFSTMKGLNIVFRAGWDTQGLPVELQAERELGLKGSKAENLAAIGEEALVKACKALIEKYAKSWIEADRLLGLFLDYSKAYWTYKDEYIEREWKYLERAWESGLMGEGYRVVAYCPGCQTSLSHGEVGQGYEQVTDPSLYFKMRLSERDAYLVLWTTMPFTIVTDEMVGVKRDADYSFLRVGGERWVVASERVQPLMQKLGVRDFRVIDTVKGVELQGLRYRHPLLKYVPGLAALAEEGRVHQVVAEEFVDTTTGSGLVHLSPANGESDFEVAKRRGLPVFCPIDDQLRFTGDAGEFHGMFVRDADARVVELLRKEGGLLQVGKTVHQYPLCWRSGHKLVWVARREYFYWVDRLGEKAVGAAEKVKYFYEPPKNRFLEIIREKVPWCISRERIWGTPLPIWVCTACGHTIPVFSRKEILERALDLPDGPDFELHRPWIERVTLKCPECGGVAKREPFVLDTWHDSGAAPYASFTDEEYGQLVPAEFLTEGIDQTRGWAYTLLIENVILTGEAQPPYKAFLFQGHVLDERGNKMSKSLGNVIDGVETLRDHSVDTLRYYMMWKAAPADALNFSFREMNGRPYQVLSTLYHTHVYFQQNSSYDNFDPSTHGLEWAEKNGLLRTQERWLLSKLHSLIGVCTEGVENCRYHDAARALEGFVIEELSQTYIPVTRGEIWDDSPHTLPRRLAIYATLSHVLKTLDALLHPVAPYLTEYLYQACFPHVKASILLERWPAKEARYLNEGLEAEFELIEELASLGNAARAKARLKRRWPLGKAIILLDQQEVDKVARLAPLLMERLNVKDVEVRSSAAAEKVAVELGLGSYEVAEKDGRVVVLQTKRDSELMAEGVVRDLARRMQALRKERGFNPTDMLAVAYTAGLDKDTQALVQGRLEELAYLVRVRRAEVMERPREGIGWCDAEIDGKPVKISVESKESV